MELLLEILFKPNFLNPNDIAGPWTERNAVQQMICVLHNRYRQRKREFGLKTRDAKRPCGRRLKPAPTGLVLFFFVEARREVIDLEIIGAIVFVVGAEDLTRELLF